MASVYGDLRYITVVLLSRVRVTYVCILLRGSDSVLIRLSRFLDPATNWIPAGLNRSTSN